MRGILRIAIVLLVVWVGYWTTAYLRAGSAADRLEAEARAGPPVLFRAPAFRSQWVNTMQIQLDRAYAKQDQTITIGVVGAILGVAAFLGGMWVWSGFRRS